MRERPAIVAPSVARVRKPEKFSRCCDPVRIPQSFLDAAARRHYPRRTFPQHPKCAEKILDAHPSARPCHCHCLFARRYRAGDAFPPRPAKRNDNGKVDRKSTRLNSSHQIISYAVFCLKKKTKKKNTQTK